MRCQSHQMWMSFWWVEARFGNTFPVNRVKNAHDHVVPPCEWQHCHTEKRTKETIKWHSHFMSLASHLPISKYDKFWIWNVTLYLLWSFRHFFLQPLKSEKIWPKYFFEPFFSVLSSWIFSRKFITNIKLCISIYWVHSGRKGHAGSL